MSHKFVKPKVISVKVRLRTATYANFLEYYHKGTSLDDHFYKYLTNLVQKNKGSEDFKSNFTSEGFYFKTKDFVKCKNLSNKSCLLVDLLDQDITAKLKIQPYDFTVDNKHLSGLAITLVEAYATMSDL